METREITSSDVSEMTRMVLTLINGMGMKEAVANLVVLSLKESYEETPPILW